MKKFTKQLLTGILALGLIAPVAATSFSYNPLFTANARRRVSVPYRYRHNWYGHHMEYKIRKYYGYFSDTENRHHHHNHWIRYRYSHLRHGWIGTINYNEQATPFKMYGHHITIQYDVSRLNLYR